MRALKMIPAVVLACGLLVGPAVAANAAPIHVDTLKVKSFANCTQLHGTYPGGVAKNGVRFNKVSGKNRAFKVRPAFSTALYNANSKLDRDKDGIACEK